MTRPFSSYIYDFDRGASRKPRSVGGELHLVHPVVLFVEGKVVRDGLVVCKTTGVEIAED